MQLSRVTWLVLGDFGGFYPALQDHLACRGVLCFDLCCDSRWLLLLAGDSTFHSRGGGGLQEGRKNNPAFPNPWPAFAPGSGCSSPVLNLRHLWQCQTDDVPWLVLSIFLHCKQHIYLHILRSAIDLVIWGCLFLLPLPSRKNHLPGAESGVCLKLM